MVRGSRFWWTHALLPGGLFLLYAPVAATTGLDEVIARAWAFDPAAARFIGAGAGAWWAKDLIHAGGGLAVRLVGGLAVLTWLLATGVDRLRAWRRPAGFLVLCALLGAGAVGLLKQATNVDCPWSLMEFGGTRPYVQLLSDRPDFLPRAQCFPGGHSSSGFALFALYFLALGRNRNVARWLLALALLTGGVFAFGQEARGAHFLSHDVWSAAIVWFSCLAIYRFVYRGDVWVAATPPSTDTANLPALSAPHRAS